MDPPKRDTSDPAAAVQRDVLRRLTGAERLAIAMDMCDFARDLAQARLRKEHPEWSDYEVKLELLRYAFLPDPLPPLPAPEPLPSSPPPDAPPPRP